MFLIYYLCNFFYRFSKPDDAFIYNTTDALKSACLANKSMTFLALDSNHHYHTAKVFGINLNHYRERTAVVIYDMKVLLSINYVEKLNMQIVCALLH